MNTTLLQDWLETGNVICMDDYDAGYIQGVIDTSKYIMSKQNNENKIKKDNTILDRIKHRYSST